MFKSPRLNAVRDWIVVLLVRKFKAHPGPQMEVTSEDIEIRWTEWIRTRSGSRPRSSNVARRFRELRREWRKAEMQIGENTSRLRLEAGIIGLTRLTYSPLRLSVTQALAFEEADCPLIKTDEKQL
jgi:hypothetical protein